LAIIFLLGVMPFAVAFITNAGSSSDENWENSMYVGTNGPGTYSYVWFNGDENWTEFYDDPATTADDHIAACSFIVEGECVGIDVGYPVYAVMGGGSYLYGVDWKLPAASTALYQSHRAVAGGQTGVYVGSSGDGPFAYKLGPQYFDAMEQNMTLDKWRFTFVDREVNYNCANDIFTNVTFDGTMQFIYNGRTKTYTGFEFEESTKYFYETWDQQNGHWIETCHIGFDIVWDFTGFESLEIAEFNGGDWDSTEILFTLDNFKLADPGFTSGDIGTSALPIAGDHLVDFSIEHQQVSTAEAGFIIKTGTLFLAVGTFAFALASTPYWDPFRNFFKGALD
jgi:hypothetical protein